MASSGWASQELDATEVSDAPLRWASKMFDAEKLHVGFFPDCIPSNRKYRLIFLSSTEYFFTEPELIETIRNARYMLEPGGQVVLIS